MVDSRAKGARVETQVRDKLRTLTKLKWERTPLSGATSPLLKMKGDLFIPGENNRYCVEVKGYKDDHLTSKYLTSVNPMISTWWAQALREAKQTDKLPLLIFKFDRSKLFVAFDLVEVPVFSGNFMYLSRDKIYVMELEDWIKQEEPSFII